MRQDLLESVTRRDGLYLIWCPGQESSLLQWFRDLAQAMSSLGPAVIVDFSRTIPIERPVGASLLDTRLHQGAPDQSDDRTIPWTPQIHLLPTGIFEFPADLEIYRLRNLLVNIQLVREQFRSTIVILPTVWKDSFGALAKNASGILVWPTESLRESTLDEVRHLVHSSPIPVLWLGSDLSKPEQKRLRGSLYPVRQNEAALLAEDLIDARRVHVLRKNPPDSWVPLVHRFWWLAGIILSALAFIVPVTLDAPISLARDMESQKALYSGKPFLQVRFDGNLTAQRMARHSIGRFTALVTAESETHDYLVETLLKNKTDTSGWGSEPGGALTPPAETLLRFYPPDHLFNPRVDSLMPAWKYFTAILSDSAAYVTEYFNETGMGGRRHLGMDIAGHKGTRILAPFSGKAWTTLDDRGGVVIALSNGVDVLLFMHCDQLLYLDGQEVFAGDPLATVGMTGHTTGPHVHLVTGKVRKNGPSSAGPIRYQAVNPVGWVAEYSLRMREK
jgi:murein DD-endopeptidase MepM/ murein hydrolase activator NlpD